MGSYEEKIQLELDLWVEELLKYPSLWDRSAKKIQNRINAFIPAKVHEMITKSIKGMVKATLIGSEFVSKKQDHRPVSLRECDEQADVLITAYKRTAAVEGVGTGAGGFLLGLADFPVLLGIKMKFLFALSGAYGYDVRDYRERLYILHLFQLAYSSPFKRSDLFATIMDWPSTISQLPPQDHYLQHIDWQSLQQDYRDYIDLPKMLQMVPGFGAIVGGVANYRFIDTLGKTAKNAFRLRYIQELKKQGWLSE